MDNVRSCMKIPNLCLQHVQFLKIGNLIDLVQLLPRRSTRPLFQPYKEGHLPRDSGFNPIVYCSLVHTITFYMHSEHEFNHPQIRRCHALDDRLKYESSRVILVPPTLSKPYFRQSFPPPLRPVLGLNARIKKMLI